MPYFKSVATGARGHVNDEAVMTRLEESGYVRLEGTELYARIVWEALKEWGIPAACALATFHFYSDPVVGLIIFASVQKILD